MERQCGVCKKIEVNGEWVEREITNPPTTSLCPEHAAEAFRIVREERNLALQQQRELLAGKPMTMAM